MNLSFIDYFLSQDIFKNVQFADKLVQFWYKMRYNVLSCNVTLSKWNGVDAKCVIDGYPIESMAHLLNSCKEFNRNYSARHDKICNKLCFELPGLWSCITGKNKFLPKFVNILGKLRKVEFSLNTTNIVIFYFQEYSNIGNI